MRLTQIGLTITVVVLLMTTMLRSQQTPPVGPVWEYSSVSGDGGQGVAAQICYATASGCKYERVTAPDHHYVQEAVMMAAAKLGEKGWELTTAHDGFGNNRDSKILYFKRLRSVINRDNSGSR